MRDLIKRFVREEEGATMVEYGLMVALIAVVCILVVAALGTAVGEKFDITQQEVNNAGTAQIQPGSTPLPGAGS
jgi:pilus assembly protein Flp/PilA